jgi:hypothetical protein
MSRLVNMNRNEEKLLNCVENKSDFLASMSKSIWKRPELGLEESHASKLISGELGVHITKDLKIYPPDLRRIHKKLTLDTPCGGTGRKGFPFFSNVV